MGKVGGRWIASFHSQQDVICECCRPPTQEQQQRQTYLPWPTEPRGSGLLEINAAFSPLMCGNAAHSDALLVIIPFMLACFVQSLLLNR